MLWGILVMGYLVIFNADSVKILLQFEVDNQVVQMTQVFVAIAISPLSQNLQCVVRIWNPACSIPKARSMPFLAASCIFANRESFYVFGFLMVFTKHWYSGYIPSGSQNGMQYELPLTSNSAIRALPFIASWNMATCQEH